MILTILLPLCVNAQSKESKQLFKQGVAHFDAEEYAEALSCFQKCASLDKKKLKPSSENSHRAELKIADCKEEIASLADDDGDYAEALKLQTEVVEIRKRILGEEHQDYATALYFISNYYYYISNFQEAI
ncbi:MAG: tetratricopeptide repeat protein, partial [Bacteroidales bacterium]|nr:tetratricopeptide repeat protein [Bacteroidales bacterium]